MKEMRLNPGCCEPMRAGKNPMHEIQPKWGLRHLCHLHILYHVHIILGLQMTSPSFNDGWQQMLLAHHADSSCHSGDRNVALLLQCHCKKKQQQISIQEHSRTMNLSTSIIWIYLAHQESHPAYSSGILLSPKGTCTSNLDRCWIEFDTSRCW